MPAMITRTRFCAVGALIRTTYMLTGDHEQAHRLGWKVAGLVATAANLRTSG